MRARWCWLAWLFLLGGCPVPPNQADAGMNVLDPQFIGPAGGTLRSSDGRLTLEVPAGALTELVPLRVLPLSTGPDDSSEGAIYQLTPSGTIFLLPVTLRYQINDTLLQGAPPHALSLQVWNNTRWQRVGIPQFSPDRTVVSTELEHLSIYRWSVVRCNRDTDCEAPEHCIAGRTTRYCGIPCRNNSDCPSGALSCDLDEPIPPVPNARLAGRCVRLSCSFHSTATSNVCGAGATGVCPVAPGQMTGSCSGVCLNTGDCGNTGNRRCTNQNTTSAQWGVCDFLSCSTQTDCPRAHTCRWNRCVPDNAGCTCGAGGCPCGCGDDVCSAEEDESTCPADCRGVVRDGGMDANLPDTLPPPMDALGNDASLDSSDVLSDVRPDASIDVQTDGASRCATANDCPFGQGCRADGTCGSCAGGACACVNFAPSSMLWEGVCPAGIPTPVQNNCAITASVSGVSCSGTATGTSFSVRCASALGTVTCTGSLTGSVVSVSCPGYCSYTGTHISSVCPAGCPAGSGCTRCGCVRECGNVTGLNCGGGCSCLPYGTTCCPGTPGGICRPGETCTNCGSRVLCLSAGYTCCDGAPSGYCDPTLRCLHCASTTVCASSTTACCGATTYNTNNERCCGTQVCDLSSQCLSCGGSVVCAETGARCCGSVVCRPTQSCCGTGSAQYCC